MTTLRQLRLGSLSAESDDDLFDYFVVTPIAQTIVEERIGIVLGRKGSGKTALFRQLEELLRRFDQADVEVIRLNMDDHAWEAFSQFQQLGLSTEHAATVSWHLALLLQIAAAVADNQASRWTPQADVDVDILARFLSDNFGDLKGNIAQSRSLFNHFSGLQVDAFGVGFGASFDREAKPSQLVPSLTQAISERLVSPLQNTRFLIALDQLDESWDGSDHKKALFVGLLKAVKRVNDDFGWRPPEARGARVLAFLRTDIHEALSFDDKDKHRDTAVEIRWTHNELSEMLALRTQVQERELFASLTNQKKGRIPKGSLNYLISRTFMRPRDLLQFLARMRTEFPNVEQITKSIVEATEPSYSRDKVDDLRQEYRKGAPWIDLALDALRQGPNKFDSRTQLEERLAARIADSQLEAVGLTISDFVERLVEISVLGAAPRSVRTQTIQFRCEGTSVSLEGDSTAWVHPALFLGLGLSEPRASRS